MRFRLGFAASCLLVFLAVMAPASAGAATFIIDATDGFTFIPSTLTIQVGDSVTWRSQGQFSHNVVSNGNFRCANGCDDTGGNGDPATGWTFTRTFNTPGTIVYFCFLHGGPTAGMRGTVFVEGEGPQPQNGTLRFSQASYSFSEATVNATITVSRISGTDGAVSVDYRAQAGTASAPQDFLAVAGSLSWANGDAANKTFNVPIVNDSVQEPNETVQLSLSNPFGGAVLDPARTNVPLTILDNDAPTTGPPAAPTNLRVTSTSAAEIQIAWNDNAGNETDFRIEQKALGGTFADVGTVAANATTFSASGLNPAKLYFFRVRAGGSGGTFSAYSNEASAATDTTPGPCVADATTLCINGGRYKAKISWRTGDGSGVGSAVPIPSAPDSGLFFFFNATNIEMLLKVLNACAVNSRYWVFFAATTNVEFTLTVTDTQSGKVKVYFNPLNSPAAPIQDVDAFATCP
jgi:plastocyanin